MGEKTCTSPVQPSRSSRCGQSVGTSRKLPRMLHTTFSWNWFSRVSDELNQPVRSQVGAHDDGLDVLGAQIRHAVDLAHSGSRGR